MKLRRILLYERENPVHLVAGPYKGHCLYRFGDHCIEEFKKHTKDLGFTIKDFYDIALKGLKIIIDEYEGQKYYGSYVLIKVDKTKKRGELGYALFGLPVVWGSDVIRSEKRVKGDTGKLTGKVATTLGQKEVRRTYPNDEKLFIENINEVVNDLERSRDIYYNGYASFRFDNPHIREFDRWVQSGKEHAEYEIIEIE